MKGQAICKCGHTGDGDQSNHEKGGFGGCLAYVSTGAGNVRRCACAKFEHKRWTRAATRLAAKAAQR